MMISFLNEDHGQKLSILTESLGPNHHMPSYFCLSGRFRSKH